MTATADIPADGLRAALAASGLEAAPRPMPDTGLAHAHFRLPGTGLIARVPKQSQMRLAAEANLAYQAACYRRASPTGHAPRLDRVLPPSEALPRGALIVEEIRGRPARLPGDLRAIVDALAALHALPLPDKADRPPLLSPADPLGDLAAEIGAQAAHLDAADLHPDTRARLDAEIARLETLVAGDARPIRRLISFDAHPGNFLIDPTGRAVLVDLEKCRYGAPELDLAHATLYTSTTWDVASHAVLSTKDVAAACDRWQARLRPEGGALWIVPLRRAMWTWSMTWCAKWRVLSGQAALREATGEDWSAERSDAALIAHVRDRVDHYLDPGTAARVAAGFDDLARLIGGGPATSERTAR